MPFDIFILLLSFKRPASENKKICLWFDVQFHYCKSPSFFVKNSNLKRITFIFTLEVLICAREFNLPFQRVDFEMVFSKDFMISLEKDFLQEVPGKKIIWLPFREAFSLSTSMDFFSFSSYKLVKCQADGPISAWFIHFSAQDHISCICNTTFQYLPVNENQVKHILLYFEMVSDPGCRQPRKAYFVMHSPDYTKPAKSHFDDLAACKYIFLLNNFSSRFPNVAQVSRESHLRSAFQRNRIFGILCH